MDIYARKVGSSNWWRVAVNPSTVFRRLHLPNDFNPLLFSGRKFVFHHLCLVFNWLEWSTVITNLTFDNIRVGKFTIQSSTLLMKSFLVKIHIYWTDYLAPSTLRSINQLWLYCRFHLPLQFHYKWIRLQLYALIMSSPHFGGETYCFCPICHSLSAQLLGNY